MDNGTWKADAAYHKKPSVTLERLSRLEQVMLDEINELCARWTTFGATSNPILPCGWMTMKTRVIIRRKGDPSGSSRRAFWQNALYDMMTYGMDGSPLPQNCG